MFLVIFNAYPDGRRQIFLYICRDLIIINYMAKGNLFLGMARGSVGDVTLYRSNGEQISRSRNRHPANPRSAAQQVQRAISATAVQAYKAGSIIFDHAFEGRKVPSGSQRRFLSLNMRMLREAYLSDIASGTTPDNSSVAFVSPRSVRPVPNPYIISEGRLNQNLFSIYEDALLGQLAITAVAASGDDETLSQYVSRLGLSAGDIFTFVGFGFIETDQTNESLISPNCSFGFVRLIVKDLSTASAAKLVSAATYDDLFTMDSSGSTFPGIAPLTDGISLDQIVSDISAKSGSLGVIRSNVNSGERSSSVMVTDSSAYGVRSANVIAAWDPSSGGVDSELILEGGDL